MKVLVADDHPAITMTVSRMVKERVSELAKVVVLDNGDDLLLAVDDDSEAIGLAVLDLTMPGRYKRIALLREVMRRRPGLKVLVYSAHEEPHLVLAALDSGARGYVPKGRTWASLVDAFEEILGGGVYVHPTIDLVKAGQHPWFSLTDSEKDVVVALARGSDLKSLAHNTGRSYKTVTAHKYGALKKLGLQSNAQLAGYLHSEGLAYVLDLDA